MDTIQASGYTSLGPYAASKQSSYVTYLGQVIHALPSAIHPLQREILLKAVMHDLGTADWSQERQSSSSGGWCDGSRRGRPAEGTRDRRAHHPTLPRLRAHLLQSDSLPSRLSRLSAGTLSRVRSLQKMV